MLAIQYILQQENNQVRLKGYDGCGDGFGWYRNETINKYGFDCDQYCDSSKKQLNNSTSAICQSLNGMQSCTIKIYEEKCVDSCPYFKFQYKFNLFANNDFNCTINKTCDYAINSGGDRLQYLNAKENQCIESCNKKLKSMRYQLSDDFYAYVCISNNSTCPMIFDKTYYYDKVQIKCILKCKYNSYPTVYTNISHNVDGNVSYKIDVTEFVCTEQDNCLNAYSKNGTQQKYLLIPYHLCFEFISPPVTRQFPYNNQTIAATQWPSCYYAQSTNGTRYPYYDPYDKLNNGSCVEKCEFYWYNYRKDQTDPSMYDKYCTRASSCDSVSTEDGKKLPILRGDQCTDGCPNDKIYHVNTQMPYQCQSSCPKDEYGSRQCFDNCTLDNDQQKCRYIQQTCDQSEDEYIINMFQKEDNLTDEQIDQFVSQDGTLTIPCGVVNIYCQPFQKYSKKDQIQKVIVPDSVTKFIGNQYITYNNIVKYNGVFQDFTNLQEVDLPSGLLGTGIATFANCTSLQQIQIPNNVIEIQNLSFINCTNLYIINIPQQVKKISPFAFQQCYGLINLDISSVLEIGEQAFRQCTNLQTIQLSQQLQKIGYATFFNCISLIQIELPNSLQEIGSFAFSNCKQLIKVVIPNSIKVIQCGAFRYCNQLSYVTIPSSVQEIEEYAFFDCGGLICVTIDNSNCQIAETAFESTLYESKQIDQFDDVCNIQNLVSCQGENQVNYLIVIKEKEKCLDPDDVYYYVTNDSKYYYVEQCPDDMQFLYGYNYPYECVESCTTYPYYIVTTLGNQCVSDCYEPYSRPYGDYNKQCNDSCYYYVNQGVRQCVFGYGCRDEIYKYQSTYNSNLCLQNCKEGQYVQYRDYSYISQYYCIYSCNITNETFVDSDSNMCVYSCNDNTWYYLDDGEKKCRNSSSCDYYQTYYYLLEDTKQCIDESEACPVGTWVTYNKNDDTHICEVSHCDNPEYYFVNEYSSDASDCIQSCEYVWYYMNVTESDRRRTVRVCEQYSQYCPPYVSQSSEYYEFVSNLTKKSQNNICVSKCYGSGYNFISYDDDNECVDSCGDYVWYQTTDEDRKCRNDEECQITSIPPEVENQKQCVQCQEGYNYIYNDNCIESCAQWNQYTTEQNQLCVEHCESMFWSQQDNEKQCKQDICDNDEYALLDLQADEDQYQCVQSCPYGTKYKYKYDEEYDQEQNIYLHLCLTSCEFGDESMYIYQNQTCVDSCVNTSDKYVQYQQYNCINNFGQNTWHLDSNTSQQVCNYNETCEGGFIFEYNNNQCVEKCQYYNQQYKYIQDGKCVKQCNKNKFKYTLEDKENIFCIKSCFQIQSSQFVDSNNMCQYSCGDYVWYYKDGEQQCSSQTECIYNDTVKEFKLELTDQCINETQACTEYYGMKIYKRNEEQHLCEYMLCNYYKDIYNESNNNCVQDCSTVWYELDVFISKQKLTVTICDTQRSQCPPTQQQGQQYQFVNYLVKKVNDTNQCISTCNKVQYYVSAKNNNICVDQCGHDGNYNYYKYMINGKEWMCTESIECPPDNYPQYVKETYSKCLIKCQDQEFGDIFVQQNQTNQCISCDTVWRLENNDQVCYDEDQCTYDDNVKEYLLEDTKQCIDESDACPEDEIYIKKNEQTHICEVNFCKKEGYYYINRYYYNDTNCIKDCQNISYFYNVTQTKQVLVCVTTRSSCPPTQYGEYSNFTLNIGEDMCTDNCQYEEQVYFISQDKKQCAETCEQYDWKINQYINSVFYVENGTKYCTAYQSCQYLQQYPKLQQTYDIEKYYAYNQCVEKCDSKVWEYFNEQQVCVSECREKQLIVYLNDSEQQCIQQCSESQDTSKIYQQDNVCTEQCYDEYAMPVQTDDRTCDNTCTFYKVQKDSKNYLQCIDQSTCPESYPYEAKVNEQRKQCSSNCADIIIYRIKYIKNNQCVSSCDGYKWIQVQNQNQCTQVTDCDELSTQDNKYVQDEDIEDKCVLFDITVNCTQNNFKYQDPQFNKCLDQCTGSNLWYWFNQTTKVCVSQYENCSQLGLQLSMTFMEVEGSNQCAQSCPQNAQYIHENKCIAQCPGQYATPLQSNGNCSLTCNFEIFNGQNRRCVGESSCNQKLKTLVENNRYQCSQTCQELIISDKQYQQNNQCVEQCSGEYAIPINGYICNSNCSYYINNYDGNKHCIQNEQCPNNMYLLNNTRKYCISDCSLYSGYIDNQMCVGQCQSSIWNNVNGQKQCLTQEQCSKQNKYAFIDGITNQCLENYNETQLNNSYHVIYGQIVYIYNNILSCEQLQSLLNIITYQVGQFQCQTVNCSSQLMWYYDSSNKMMCASNCKDAQLYGYELVKHQCVDEQQCQKQNYSIIATIQDMKCNYIENMVTCQDYYNYAIVKKYIIQENDKQQCTQCKSSDLKIKNEDDVLICRQEELTSNNKQSSNAGQIAVIIILAIGMTGFIIATILLALQNKKLKQNKNNNQSNKQQSKVVICNQDKQSVQEDRNLALQKPSYDVSQINNQNNIIQQQNYQQQLQQPIQLPYQQQLQQQMQQQQLLQQQQQQQMLQQQVQQQMQLNQVANQQNDNVSQKLHFDDYLDQQEDSQQYQPIPDEFKIKPQQYNMIYDDILQSIQQSSLQPVKFGQNQNNGQVKHKKKVVKVVKKKKDNK